MLYYSRFAEKKWHHDHNICYMCFYFYNAVVCETKKKKLSIKCIIQFVNTLNKIHFYVWSVDGVFFMHVILMTVYYWTGLLNVKSPLHLGVTISQHAEYGGPGTWLQPLSRLLITLVLSLLSHVKRLASLGLGPRLCLRKSESVWLDCRRFDTSQDFLVI